MAAIGIQTSITGAPASAAVQEVTEDSSVDLKELKDYTGSVKEAAILKFYTKTRTIRGYGDGKSILTALAAGNITAAKVVSAKVTESVDDFPQFEVTTKEYPAI
jgi:hypothetical protein